MSTNHARAARLRTRWSAIGAAVAVSLGAGGFGLANAAIDSGDKPVTVTVDAKRILDTRTDLGLAGRFTDATPRELQVTGDVAVAPAGTETVVPDGATAVLVNVTVVFPSDPGFLALRSGGATGEPSTSTVNFFPGTVEPNAATVDLSSDGKIQIWVETSSDSGNAHVLIDVVGYTIDHTHDDRYHTKAQVNTELAKKANAADVYTKTEADAAHAGKANAADVYTKAEVDALLADKADEATGASSVVLTSTDFSLQQRSDLGLTYRSDYLSWAVGDYGDYGDCVVAPLTLPAGTTLTNFDVSYYFNGVSDGVDAGILALANTSPNPAVEIADVLASGGPGGGSISDSSVTSPVIDGDSRYAVRVCLTGTAEFNSAEVDFTYP